MSAETNLNISMTENKTQSLIFHLAQSILPGLFDSVCGVRREKRRGCRERRERRGHGEDGTPARPCAGGAWARCGWPSRSHVCPAAREAASRPDAAAGPRWTVAIVILSTVMGLIFEDKILMILKTLFSIGPSLSRLAFTVL